MPGLATAFGVSTDYLLGRKAHLEALSPLQVIAAESLEAFVAKVSEEGIAPASTLVEIIAILAKRPDLQELAGKMAIKAKALIEREDEVSCRASLFAHSTSTTNSRACPLMML